MADSTLIAAGPALAGLVTTPTPEDEAKGAARGVQALISTPYLTTITDQTGYDKNAAHIVVLKAAAKDLEAKRTKITVPMNASLKAVNDHFRGPADLLKRAMEACEHPMKAYIREQDDIRREADAKQRREADAERQAQENIRVAAETEMQKAREAEKEAHDAAAKEENPFLLAIAEAKAENAAEAGRVARVSAEEAIRESRRIESAPLASSVPQVKAAGTRINRPWKWEVTDKSLVPKEYLVLNEQLISATVKSLRGETAIPGIRAYEDISIGGR